MNQLVSQAGFILEATGGYHEHLIRTNEHKEYGVAQPICQIGHL